MRYSILALLSITTIAAAVFSIMLSTPVPSLAACVAFGWLLIVCGSILAITHTGEQRRAFWIGFAVFGWGYMMAYQRFERFPFTSNVLVYLMDTGSLMLRMPNLPDRQMFLLAGHCLWSLIFAGLGGTVNCYLWSLFERRAERMPVQRI